MEAMHNINLHVDVNETWNTRHVGKQLAGPGDAVIFLVNS